MPGSLSAKGGSSISSYNHLCSLMTRLLLSTLLQSACPERKVSAAIVGSDSRTYHVLSTSVNGAPKGGQSIPLYLHKRQCIHAEDRAIGDLSYDFRRHSLFSFSSLAPCYRCARKLYDIGIRAHLYLEEYDDPTGVDYLLDKGTPVYKLTHGSAVAVHPDIHLWSSGFSLSSRKSGDR